jgi:hypothetical protein
MFFAGESVAVVTAGKEQCHCVPQCVLLFPFKKLKQEYDKHPVTSLN